MQPELIINVLSLNLFMKKNQSKELILKSVAKMLSDKEAVRSYIKGKSSFQSLTSKGIKLAKPL